MANRLKKVASVRYSAGSPARPATPEYTSTVWTWVPGYREPVFILIPTPPGEPPRFAIFSGAWVEGHYEYSTYSVPGTAATPAVAPSFIYTAIAGWNGGARSRASLVADGRVTFNVGARPAAVVAGLTSDDTDTTPGDIEFGLYVHGTTVEAYEDGVSVYTHGVAVNGETLFSIAREDGVIKYLVGEDVVHTSVKYSGNPLLLDAALYSSGDFVDNPVFLPAPATSVGGSTLPPLNSYGTVGTKANGWSYMPAYTVTGDAGFHAAGGVALPSYTTRGSDYAYSFGASSLPVLETTGDGGYPSVTIDFGMVYVTPLLTVGLGLTGEVGGGTSTLPSYVGVGSDHPYSYGGVRHLGVTVSAHDYAEAADERNESEVFLLADYYVPTANHAANFAEGLGLSDEYVLQVLAGETYFDSLLMSNVLAVQQAIDAVFMSALTLGDSSGVSSVGSRQYATNMLTNAVSPYANFNFLSFARCGQETYAVKQDGLYRIRQGDDDGTPISANVDFGEPVVGSRTNLQHIEDMFFGVDTDGELYAKLTVDGTVYTYAVRRRGELSRAVLPRGLRGRSWNIELEIVDASTLDLEFMEVHTDAARRWSTK